jgi:hypothetical protein
MSCEWVVCFMRSAIHSISQGAGTRTMLFIISSQEHGVRWHPAVIAEYVCPPSIRLWLLNMLSGLPYRGELSAQRP